MRDFIEHINAEQYWFNGYYIDQSFNGRRPFVVSGFFLNNSGLLMFEGTYRLSQNETAHPLVAKVLSWGLQSVVAEISTVHIGRVRGHWHFTGSSYEFLGTGPAGTAASSHIELSEHGCLRVAGSVQRSGVSMGFVAEGGPGVERERLSNVVGIHSPRQR